MVHFHLSSSFSLSLGVCVCLTHNTNSVAGETALANGFLMARWVSCVSELMATTYPKHTRTHTAHKASLSLFVLSSESDSLH